MSQLGMMVIAIGLSSYNLALFHLVNHAFYKALLFLGAGSVIHAVADNQDFRKYGGLREFLPLTYSVMLIASLSLVAVPFMTGFYSKDFILESSYGQFYLSGTIVYFVATIGAMFTTLYSAKVLYLTFLANPNGPLSSYNLALFHLVNHAFYKALLFLGAGSVIHAVADNQDFRKYGGLREFLPLTYSVMLIASLSLVAVPFMTGFYSKDFILESAYGQYYLSSTIVYFVATIGAMFTTLYSAKVLYLTFLTNPNGPLVNYKHAHEGDLFMTIPLIILAIFSIFFGYLTKDIFIGLGTGFFTDNSLFCSYYRCYVYYTLFS
jgi:NADH:ubiquinone oxidoreductase subunit 5 (subunit L)/multisubunit Na+/H+ antiporter MnhA subunit